MGRLRWKSPPWSPSCCRTVRCNSHRKDGGGRRRDRRMCSSVEQPLRFRECLSTRARGDTDDRRHRLDSAYRGGARADSRAWRKGRAGTGGSSGRPLRVQPRHRRQWTRMPRGWSQWPEHRRKQGGVGGFGDPGIGDPHSGVRVAACSPMQHRDRRIVGTRADPAGRRRSWSRAAMTFTVERPAGRRSLGAESRYRRVNMVLVFSHVA